jgi:hypothetical protein
VHRAALPRRGLGVDASRQQRVCEVEVVAVDAHDALVLRLNEEPDDLLGVDVYGVCGEFDRRSGKAGCREEGVLNLGAKGADPRAHQLRERAG